jgi:VWFA-related protein
MAQRSAAAACCALVVISLMAGAAVSGSGQAAAQQPASQPTFRSGVIIVPVDVRVLDRSGRPVTDLKKEDFTVLEDGMLQEIRHFSARGLAPMPVPAGTKPAVRTRASSPIEEQSARIFLIVLGRGRLQYPSKGVDAVMNFVRHRLLPQDQVAVLAFNRATDFTTDRARTLDALERYRRRHEDIESQFRHRQSGLAAIISARTSVSAVRRAASAACCRSGPSAGTTCRTGWPSGPRKIASMSRCIEDEGSRLP